MATSGSSHINRNGGHCHDAKTSAHGIHSPLPAIVLLPLRSQLRERPLHFITFFASADAVFGLWATAEIRPSQRGNAFLKNRWSNCFMRENPQKSKGLHSLWSIGANKIRSLNNQRMQSSCTQATLSDGAFTAWFVSQTLFFCNLIVDVRRNSVLLTGRDKPAKNFFVTRHAETP